MRRKVGISLKAARPHNKPEVLPRDPGKRYALNRYCIVRGKAVGLLTIRGDDDDVINQLGLGDISRKKVVGSVTYINGYKIRREWKDVAPG